MSESQSLRKYEHIKATEYWKWLIADQLLKSEVYEIFGRC